MRHLAVVVEEKTGEVLLVLTGDVAALTIEAEGRQILRVGTLESLEAIRDAASAFIAFHRRFGDAAS